MEPVKSAWMILPLTVIIVAMPPTTACAEWQFSGDILTDDFNDTLFGGWQSSITTEKLVVPGDRFLGPNTGASLTLMDFIQQLDGEMRLVDISFDSIHPDIGHNQFEPLTVTLNGKQYTSTLRSTAPARHGIAVPSARINFGLSYDPEFECCGDLAIRFSTVSGESFGLDNVIVDWSEAPEPSSLALMVTTIFLAGTRRRGESP